jgi:hypothetical protein
MDLPMPGGAEFSKLLDKPELVNPRTGYYEFPTVATGVDCLDDVAYVLLDLPSLSIAKCLPTGVVEILQLAAQPRSTADWEDLSVTRRPDGVVEFVLLTRPDPASQWAIAVAEVDGEQP